MAKLLRLRVVISSIHQPSQLLAARLILAMALDTLNSYPIANWDSMMEREPNLIISSASRQIVEEDLPFKVEIYKLEGEAEWALEVVTDDGISIVWDDVFADDQVAFKVAVDTIRKEGALAFANGGSNIIPFKR